MPGVPLTFPADLDPRTLHMFARRMLPVVIVCQLIGWLPFIIGAQPRWWMALLTSLAGPVIVAPLNWSSVRRAAEMRDLIDGVRNRATRIEKARK